MQELKQAVPHTWVVLNETHHSKTEAMAVGYGALVRDSVYDLFGSRGEPGVNMVYVPNVKIVTIQLPPTEADGKPTIVNVLEPHFPGRT